MVSSDIQRIWHIRSYCEDIADAVRCLGNDYSRFLADTHYANSISMCLLQIGELSVGLSAAFKEATCEQVQWGLIRGMRNRFAHAYLVMDKGEIWETAVHNIPALLAFCQSVIEKSRCESEIPAKPKDRGAR